MKFIYNILIVCALAFVAFACDDDFLGKGVQVEISPDKVYANYTYMRGVVWNTYSYLPDGFRMVENEASTDNAEQTNVLSGTQLFNNGTWTQFINPMDVWSQNFQGIQQANLYLKNKHTTSIDVIKNGVVGTDSTQYFIARDNLVYMHGEVLFLKAFFYFELTKRYGGVPIIDSAFVYEEPESWRNVQRNSLNECLQYIVQLCDEAAAIMPVDLPSWYEKGRVTKGAILALKARTLLYAASPLFVQEGSTTTWQQAAKASHDLLALNKYSLASSYEALFGADNVGTPELILEKRYGPTNYLEYDNFPILFDKSNGNSTTPSQNLVDAYEVLVKDNEGNVTGSVPFSWSNPQHANSPYENRDPRLYQTVVYNGVQFKGRMVETLTGGNSGLPRQGATNTGYYLSKWINQSIELTTSTNANHNWIFFRAGEVLLNYAEAMFNAYGESGDPDGYGKTALQAINDIRSRAGLYPLQPGELTLERIHNERRVELAFEGHRFWDVRRWLKGEQYFNAPLNKVVITSSNNNLTYVVSPLENRVFTPKMYWFPIPQNEILKTGWTQNEGW